MNPAHRIVSRAVLVLGSVTGLVLCRVLTVANVLH